MFHDGCFPKEQNISHTFSYSEMAWAASKWWENHLPHLSLMQEGDALCWFYMLDYEPPPYVHLFVFLDIILLPYIDDMLVLFMGMNGGRREGIHVPYGMTVLPILSIFYFREGIGQTMVVSCDSLFPWGMDFMEK